MLSGRLAREFYGACEPALIFASLIWSMATTAHGRRFVPATGSFCRAATAGLMRSKNLAVVVQKSSVVLLDCTAWACRQQKASAREDSSTDQAFTMCSFAIDMIKIKNKSQP